MVLIVCDFLAGKGVDAIFQFFGKADNFERCIQMVSKRAPKAKGMIFKTTTKYCHALHQTKSVKCKTSPGSLTCLFAGNWFLNMHFKDVQTLFTNRILLSNISVNTIRLQLQNVPRTKIVRGVTYAKMECAKVNSRNNSIHYTIPISIMWQLQFAILHNWNQIV